MFQQQEPAHMKVMAEMSILKQQPGAMQSYMDEKRKQFDALPDDEH
ncbi:hypothetical protein L2735_07685 [Shewanella olleyana]|nr:hypothetical protein [Shewanella olleyana]MCL1066690.1 hypothetical protein [Shewanella olleyana]